MLHRAAQAWKGRPRERPVIATEPFLDDSAAGWRPSGLISALCVALARSEAQAPLATIGCQPRDRCADELGEFDADLLDAKVDHRDTKLHSAADSGAGTASPRLGAWPCYTK